VRRTRPPVSPWPFVAVGAMAVVAFMYGYAAFAFPSPLISVVLPLVWLVLFLVTCRWFSTRPRAAVAVPVVATVVWFVVVLGTARA